MTTAALLAAVVLLWNLRDLLLLLFAAVVISVALCRLVDSIRCLISMGRIQALVLCLAGLMAVLAIFAAVVIPPFIGEFALLLAKLPKAAAMLIDLLVGSLESMGSVLHGSDAGI